MVEPIPMLSVSDVAAWLAVSPRTVARMCARGEIPACRIGGQWRIERVPMLKWLREKRGSRWRQFTNVEASGGSASSGTAKKFADPLEQLLKAKPASISQTFRPNTAG